LRLNMCSLPVRYRTYSCTRVRRRVRTTNRSKRDKRASDPCGGTKARRSGAAIGCGANRNSNRIASRAKKNNITISSPRVRRPVTRCAWTLDEAGPAMPPCAMAILRNRASGRRASSHAPLRRPASPPSHGPLRGCLSRLPRRPPRHASTCANIQTPRQKAHHRDEAASHAISYVMNSQSQTWPGPQTGHRRSTVPRRNSAIHQ
jgi:hypothetical protein